VTLAEFLLARIAEDEGAAEPQRATEQQIQAAARALWRCRSGQYEVETYVSLAAAALAAALPLSETRLRHRVLAECDAKRRIIAECRAGIDAWPATDNDGHFEWILEALALPYADHPDYQPEWRP
jgi:hypothetical protein